MVVDTSVLLHVAFGEPGWQASLRWLSKQPSLHFSAVSLVEGHAVIMSRGRRDPKGAVDDLLDTLAVEVVPFDAQQAVLAREAYSRYGKGQGHRAQLNFGDVIVYALAASRQETLTFVGDDFSHTDLEIVRLPRNEQDA
ncbi:type II toxin-antitoxin system VapC family toxin [soil metagenome]|jgi:ribonuclease VapC|nr:type II toxin-antitoxin system VapC family toxin [Deinococcota bacterium]